jgi:cyclopropane fatty-acyl-phospholipid synthase-like methyltransferase
MINDFKKQLIIAYDADAKRRSNEKRRAQWKLDVRQQFADLLKKEKKETILELGSGAGIDAKFFQDSGFKVLATDLSEEMVKMCKKRDLNAKVIDLYNLSSLNTTFDGIYSMNVLLHVPKADLAGVLWEIHKTLNEKGIFFYGVYGGVDEDKIITDKSKMNLPRFFSYLSDESLLNVVKDLFEVIEFKVVDSGSGKPNFYFQSLFLKRK